MKIAARQLCVQILGVDRRDNRISTAGNDPHGRLNVRQYISERFKLRGVRLHVADRLGESSSLVRSQVVLASGVAEYVALERLDHALENRASTDPSIRLEVGRKHPFA